MNPHPQDQRTPAPPPGDSSASLPRLNAPKSRPGPPPGAPSRDPGSRLQEGSIRLFRVAGIDVLLHWSWLFFALLRLQPTHSNDPLQFANYDSQAWYVAEYLALFGFVLLHEFGHVLACRSVGSGPARAEAEKHPRIRAALTDLKDVRQYLKDSASGFGGHKKKAIEAVDQLKRCLGNG